MNPYNPNTERQLWLRWEISMEVAHAFGPYDATRRWCQQDRPRMISHCLGTINSAARRAQIPAFDHFDIAGEIELVARCHGVR